MPTHSKASFEILEATSGEATLGRITAMIEAGLKAQVRLIITMREKVEALDGRDVLGAFGLTCVGRTTQGNTTTIRAKIGMLPLKELETLRTALDLVLRQGGTVKVEQKSADALRSPLTRPDHPAAAGRSRR